MYTQYRGIHTYMLMDGYLEDVGMMCIILAWVNFESFVPSWCFGTQHVEMPSEAKVWASVWPKSANGCDTTGCSFHEWPRECGIAGIWVCCLHLGHGVTCPYVSHCPGTWLWWTVQPCPRVKLNAEAWRIAAAELLSQLEVKALASTGFGIKHDWYHYTYCQCSCAPWTLKWALTSRAHRARWIQLRAVKVEGDLPQICGIRKIIDKCNDSFTFLVQKGALVSRRSVHWLRTWKALPSCHLWVLGRGPRLRAASLAWRVCWLDFALGSRHWEKCLWVSCSCAPVAHQDPARFVWKKLVVRLRPRSNWSKNERCGLCGFNHSLHKDCNLYHWLQSRRLDMLSTCFSLFVSNPRPKKSRMKS